MKYVATRAVMRALKKAYETGALSLAGLCPNCFERMDYFDHGKCRHCGEGCGCSFNPTSSGDYCSFHRRS
jgi:hypothetical protein